MASGLYQIGITVHSLDTIDCNTSEYFFSNHILYVDIVNINGEITYINHDNFAHITDAVYQVLTD